MDEPPDREFAMEAFVASLILTPLIISVLILGDPGDGIKFSFLLIGLPVFVCTLGGFSLAGAIAKNSAFPWVFFIFLGLVFTVIFMCAIFFVGCLVIVGGI